MGKRRREFDHVASAKICHVEIARCIERQSERNRPQQRDGVQQAPIIAEDVDDVGRGKVERRDINIPLRIGGNSLGVAGARRQRGKADDATFIRVCRKDTDGQQQPGHEKCKNCFTHIASLVCIDPFMKRCSRLLSDRVPMWFLENVRVCRNEQTILDLFCRQTVADSVTFCQQAEERVIRHLDCSIFPHRNCLQIQPLDTGKRMLRAQKSHSLVFDSDHAFPPPLLVRILESTLPNCLDAEHPESQTACRPV